MTEEELNRITNTIEQTIKVVVNGKIDKINDKLDAHMLDNKNYIERDELWKAQADPYIKLAVNISGTWKFLVYIAGTLLALIVGYKNLK